jgi:DNA helicase HerA-like ATPase
MILGKIEGKVTTNYFSFTAEKEAKKFEYVQVPHKAYEYVLCQVIEIEKNNGKTIAQCQVIGYQDNGSIKKPRIPFEPGTEVLKAEDEFIKQIVKLEEPDKGAYVGKLEGKNISVMIDLKKLLTKHLAVLAKSGAGKSYAVGVLLEEIIDKKVPVLVIDPHGEYTTLSKENDDKEELKQMQNYNIKPASYKTQEYGDQKINQKLKPLLLNNVMTNQELLHLIPGKLNNNQLAVLYSSLKNLDTINFTNILLELEKEESPAKWSIISIIEYLNNLKLFSENPTPYNELIKSGTCSIVNLKGVTIDVQQIIVYKLCKDLFELRKKNKIPPFFMVIEEAHQFCPERSFGETKSSKILRDIASEGRKFGLGLCVISQRPARVDKSVLSQCTTQIILKVTNPNDLRAITNSVEGITGSSEKELQNLPVGSAMVTGITDMPLFVSIRPRRTMHGGKAVNILEEEKDVFEEMKDFQEKELLPIIKPKTSIKDLKLMSEQPVEIKTKLIPAYQFVCKEKNDEYNLLMDMTNGEIITNTDEYETKRLPEMESLTQKELNLLKTAFKLGEFLATDIIKALGTNIDVEEELLSLSKKGYLVKDKNYKVSENYIFSRLSNHKNFDQVEFIEYPFDKKEDARMNLDQMKEKLNKFTSVVDQRECYLVKYEKIATVK